MKKYELWRSEDGERESFFEAGNEAGYGWLEPGSTLVWTTEARSYNEAQKKRYKFMKGSVYRPIEEEIESD